MICRTLYFGNPAYLLTKDKQLVIAHQLDSVSDERTRD